MVGAGRGWWLGLGSGDGESDRGGALASPLVAARWMKNAATRPSSTITDTRVSRRALPLGPRDPGASDSPSSSSHWVRIQTGAVRTARKPSGRHGGEGVPPCSRKGGGAVAEPATSLKVLSIVGGGRSGSTVLASILGEAPGFASAGEIRWLWLRGVVERRPCACGLAPSDCPVWAPVVARTLASVDGDDADHVLAEIIAAQSEVASLPHRLRVLRSASSPTTSWPALDV